MSGDHVRVFHMTQAEHVKRHKILHSRFDELLADFITHTGRMPSRTNLNEFMEWSYQQTIKPDMKPGEVYRDE